MKVVLTKAQKFHDDIREKIQSIGYEIIDHGAETEEFTSNLSIRKPDEIIERMKACGIKDICAAEIGRRIKGAEKAVKGYPELSGKLLDFCAAMRELALG